MSDDILKKCHIAVLCGGRGVRLKPATDHIPKALVELKGKPILDYILEMCASKGFKDVTLCVGYKGEMIKERYQSNTLGLNIAFSDAGEEAGMLERLHQLKNTPCERLIIVYGDTFIDLDLAQMVAEHVAKQADATILTATIRNPFGLVETDEGWVSSFQEKPVFDYYVGCFMLERSVLEGLDAKLLKEQDAEGLVTFFCDLAKQKKLGAYQYQGPQITFNTETERQIAEDNLITYYTLSDEE